MTKQQWLDGCEMFDAARVVPRLLLAAFACWGAYVFDLMLRWYIHAPAAERSVQDAGMVTALLSAMTALFVQVCRFYMQTGRTWDSGESSTTTMTATRTSP